MGAPLGAPPSFRVVDVALSRDLTLATIAQSSWAMAGHRRAPQ
jgi:hypothetical protein